LEFSLILSKKIHSPIWGPRDQFKADMADLAIDNLPPYHIMEENLRNSITYAKSLGLGNLKGMEELEKIAFS